MFWILCTEQSVWGLIFVNRGETTNRLIKPVIVLVIIAHGNFTQEDRASTRLQFKVMVHIGIYGNALARF